jgi:hypothetical protein
LGLVLAKRTDERTRTADLVIRSECLTLETRIYKSYDSESRAIGSHH